MRHGGRGTRRPLVRAVRALGLGAAVAAAGLGLWGLLATAVARQVVRPVRRFPDDLPILGVGGGPDGRTVTLAATPETVVPGRYGLFFSGGTGYARLGDRVDPDAPGPIRGTVTRRVDRVVRGDLDRAVAGRWSGWYYLDPQDLDVPVTDVGIPTELGEQPAWAIRADGPATDWAVLVHGRGVTRAETLRAVPPLRAAGWNCLCISYRNDRDALPSLDGRYGLGQSEWADAEAALDWTVAEGAERLLLVGWSMGGATALQVMDRSRHRDHILGAALDSPVVDWHDVLREQARARRLPPGVHRTAVRLMADPRAGSATGLLAPIDLTRLDWVSRAADLDRPILIQHSRADRTVPFGPSARLAALRPDLVTMAAWEEAQHTRLWNVDPARWERTLTDWLASVS